MTIPTSTGNAELTYEGNGTTTIFDIPFTFTAATEIAVYLNGSVATGVSIFGAGDPFGGTAVFAGAPASGAVIRIRRLQTLHVSGNDTTAGTLGQKLVAGTGVTLTEQTDGGNETLQISATALPDPAEVKVSSNDTAPGFLNGKLVAGTGVTLTEQSDGGNETLEIAVTGSGLLPIGLVAPFAGASAPGGWLLCDGAAVSRETYAALFTVIDTTYGAGDGTSTFNLPDLRGRAAAGKDDMGGTAANRLTVASAAGLNGAVLGAGGGNQQHQLTVAELAAHSHVLPITAVAPSGAGGYGGSTGSLTLNTNPTGGDQPHNNVQPTLILNYIIKA